MPGNGKYTPEIAQKIAELVGNGTPVTIAAQACGVNEDTFYRWLKKHEDFAELVEQKRAQTIDERVARIKAAGKKGIWTADAWWLERQKHEHFGQRPERKDINIKLEVRDCTKD